MPTLEQSNAATREFVANTPELGAYLTEENMKQIGAYVQGAYPDAVTSPAAYEIAFKDLLSKGKLKRISGYVAPITEESMLRPLERALTSLCWATVVLALALAYLRFHPH